MTIIIKSFDMIGSAVDLLFLSVPRIAKPFKPARDVDQQRYEREIDFYFEKGYVDQPQSFFDLSEEIPAFRIVEDEPCGQGRYQVIAYDSTYTVKNPLIAAHYTSFQNNRSGYIVRWTHGRQNQKTILCLHGYMLGNPRQAQRMFRIKKLFAMGLDVALFIAPFHWKRAPDQAIQRGIFLQNDHAGMTCEAMGQAMSDLYHSLLILEQMGAGPTGIIGASLGGYLAALFSCLTDRHAFAAMIVPAVNFSKPFGPACAKLKFRPDASFQERITRVWELHSPLNFLPKLTTDKMLFVGSRGDKLCPFEYLLQLKRKWNFPRFEVMTGGHWLIFNERKRGSAWYGFLSEIGFMELPKIPAQFRV